MGVKSTARPGWGAVLVALNYECNIAVKRFSAIGSCNKPIHNARIGGLTVVLPGLERRLKAELTGDVQFDRYTRGRYATDASHYQITPVGVVAPRPVEEAERAIGIARQEGVTVLARGGALDFVTVAREFLFERPADEFLVVYDQDFGFRHVLFSVWVRWAARPFGPPAVAPPPDD